MIREIQQEDVAAVARIYNHYIENTTISFEESPVSTGEMFSRVEEIRLAGFPWLVMMNDDEVCGYAYASFWNTRSAYRYTAEATVYLQHDITGQGRGKRLYEDLFSRLRTMGIRTIIGGIALPNDASVALHEKMGLVKVAHFAGVGCKFGQRLDVGYWQGNLDSMVPNG